MLILMMACVDRLAAASTCAVTHELQPFPKRLHLLALWVV